MACHDTTPSFEEYELPAVEAVLAGTLALMTAHAQACCPAQRRLMKGRIVSNLAVLGEHPQLTTVFRCALDKLRCHWELMLEDGGEAPDPERLRHPTPATLQ